MTNRFSQLNTLTGEPYTGRTDDEIEAERLVTPSPGTSYPTLWDGTGYPTVGRPEHFAVIADRAEAAYKTYERILAAYQEAKDAVIRADTDHTADVDRWVANGCEGKAPTRTGVDRAEKNLSEAGLHLKSAASNAARLGKAAHAALEGAKADWSVALVQEIAEAREEAVTAVVALRETLAAAAGPAQEAVSRLYDLVRSAAPLTGSDDPGSAPELAALLAVKLPEPPKSEEPPAWLEDPALQTPIGKAPKDWSNRPTAPVTISDPGWGDANRPY